MDSVASVSRIPRARNVAILSLCQALFFTSVSTVISTTTFVGTKLAPSPLLASMAFGLQFGGAMTATVPASFLMRRFGRRRGFQVGSLFGIIAGVIGWDAITRGSFVGFCAGSFVFGVFSSFCQLLRFAAADVAVRSAETPAQVPRLRGQVIGWVMAGGVAAAVLGPTLARETRTMFPTSLYAGCFAAIAVFAAAIGIAVSWLDPLRQPPAKPQGSRSLRRIADNPAALAAYATGLIAYVSMHLLMTGTPLAMTSCGHSFADSSTVMSWHLFGMFGPSLLTGYLVGRFGAVRLSMVGLAMIFGSVAVNVSGLSITQFAVGMLLLGVGWNLMFIGATTLLTSAHSEDEKAKVQGLNDFMIFAAISVSATLAAVVEHTLGWTVMNLLPLPGLVVVVVLLLRAQRHGAR